MRTKLQKICLVAGLAFFVAFFIISGTRLHVSPFSLFQINILVGLIWMLARLGAVIFAGYVANDINRGEFFFIMFTLFLPGPALIVLSLIKPRHYDE